ncbi:MAG: FliH/SctL family protein [Lautropia sp.]|nr:FliH/SctL family protein [Lautropia sp.]
MPWSDPLAPKQAQSRPARISRQDAWQPASVPSFNGPDPAEVAERERRAAQEAAERELHRQVEAAWQAGHEAGVSATRAEHQAEQDRLGMAAQAHVDALLHDFGQGLDALKEDLAARVMALALRFGEQIACQQLSLMPEGITAVLSDSLEQLGGQYRSMELSVHPDDVALVADWMKLHHPEMSIRVLGVAGLSRGGCRLETGAMRVDATLETRIQRAYAGMGVDRHLDTPAPVPGRNMLSAPSATAEYASMAAQTRTASPATPLSRAASPAPEQAAATAQDGDTARHHDADADTDVNADADDAAISRATGAQTRDTNDGRP